MKKIYASKEKNEPTIMVNEYFNETKTLKEKLLQLMIKQVRAENGTNTFENNKKVMKY